MDDALVASPPSSLLKTGRNPGHGAGCAACFPPPKDRQGKKCFVKGTNKR